MAPPTRSGADGEGRRKTGHYDKAAPPSRPCLFHPAPDAHQGRWNPQLLFRCALICAYVARGAAAAIALLISEAPVTLNSARSISNPSVSGSALPSPSMSADGLTGAIGSPSI